MKCLSVKRVMKPQCPFLKGSFFHFMSLEVEEESKRSRLRLFSCFLMNPSKKRTHKGFMGSLSRNSLEARREPLYLHIITVILCQRLGHSWRSVPPDTGLWPREPNHVSLMK